MPLSEAHADALAEIYARSLYQLAEAKGGRAAIEEIAGELETIVELTRANPAFGEFLASRILPAADRAKSLDAIFKGRLSDLTLRFLQITNEKDRLYHLPAIAASYDALVQHAFGRVEVDVYTADPLAGEELREVRAQLHKALGREPVLHTYVEPAMIGGVKLQIGDHLIDGSILSQLRRLKDQILADASAALRARADRLIDGAGADF